jgi:hypothetical protein
MLYPSLGTVLISSDTDIAATRPIPHPTAAIAPDGRSPAPAAGASTRRQTTLSVGRPHRCPVAGEAVKSEKPTITSTMYMPTLAVTTAAVGGPPMALANGKLAVHPLQVQDAAPHLQEKRQSPVRSPPPQRSPVRLPLPPPPQLSPVRLLPPPQLQLFSML